MKVPKIFNFAAILAGDIVIHENASSPSHITALKKSSVWLHWNYTYGGDYSNIITFSHQSITYKSRYGSTPVELARRKDQFSAIKKLSSISDPIGTRIAVISDNCTLVVHDLRLNDSGSSFSSYVSSFYKGKPRPNSHLKPIVQLLVQGNSFSFI